MSFAELEVWKKGLIIIFCIIFLGSPLLIEYFWWESMPNSVYYIFYGAIALFILVLAINYYRKNKPKEDKEKPKKQISIAEAKEVIKKEAMEEFGFTILPESLETRYAGTVGSTNPILIVTGYDYFTNDEINGFINAYDKTDFTLKKKLTEKQREKCANDLSMNPEKMEKEEIERTDEETGKTTRITRTKPSIKETKKEEKSKGGLG